MPSVMAMAMAMIDAEIEYSAHLQYAKASSSDRQYHAQKRSNAPRISAQAWKIDEVAKNRMISVAKLICVKRGRGCRMLVCGSGVSGLGSRVSGLGSRVSGLGSRLGCADVLMC